jgi:transcriptional antiterminator RfaH
MNSERASDTLCWYAIHAKPRQEIRADSNLRAWNVQTFAPRWRERLSHKRCGQVCFESKPLFPGYFFARFKASSLLHKVKLTRGVRGVISYGDQPAPVDDQIIELIQSRMDADGFVRLVDELRSGDDVQIKDGPLRDVVGIFECAIKDTDRVMILLTSINYQARIVVERASVRRVRGSYIGPDS